MNLSNLHQFQDCKKRNHYLQLIRLLFQHGAEAELPVFSGISHHGLDLLLQAHRFSLDGPKPAPDGIHLIFLPLHDSFKNTLELCQCQTVQKTVQVHRRLILCHLFGNRGILIKNLFRIQFPVLQFIRHIFVHLIFQQTGNQFCPGVFLLPFLIDFCRKEHSGFNIQQGSRHDQKLADHIQIFFLHLIHIFQILSCDLHDGDIINAHLIFFNQMEQQIQRPLETFQFIGNTHIPFRPFPAQVPELESV